MFHAVYERHEYFNINNFYTFIFFVENINKKNHNLVLLVLRVFLLCGIGLAIFGANLDNRLFHFMCIIS